MMWAGQAAQRVVVQSRSQSRWRNAPVVCIAGGDVSLASPGHQAQRCRSSRTTKCSRGVLRGKSPMSPIWKANGWDGSAPVTRHEARLRRDALRALGVQNAEKTEGQSEKSETSL